MPCLGTRTGELVWCLARCPSFFLATPTTDSCAEVTMSCILGWWGGGWGESGGDREEMERVRGDGIGRGWGEDGRGYMQHQTTHYPGVHRYMYYKMCIDRTKNMMTSISRTPPPLPQSLHPSSPVLVCLSSLTLSLAKASPARPNPPPPPHHLQQTPYSYQPDCRLHVQCKV